MVDSLMSPGVYLAHHRRMAGLSHDDVALRVDTVPPVSAAVRAAWLRAIEADVMPVRPSTFVALVAIPELEIDPAAFAAAIDALRDHGGDPMRIRFIAAPTLDEFAANDASAAA